VLSLYTTREKALGSQRYKTEGFGLCDRGMEQGGGDGCPGVKCTSHQRNDNEHKWGKSDILMLIRGECGENGSSQNKLHQIELQRNSYSHLKGCVGSWVK